MSTNNSHLDTVEYWLGYYNNAVGLSADEKRRILTENLGISLAPFTRLIRPHFYCINGHNIHLGNNAFVNWDCSLLDAGRIDIGEATWLGPGVAIHSTRDKPVKVGKRCWLGGKTTLLPGVTIADGAIVGAGAVVMEDIGPEETWVGVPAKRVNGSMKSWKDKIYHDGLGFSSVVEGVRAGCGSFDYELPNMQRIGSNFNTQDEYNNTNTTMSYEERRRILVEMCGSVGEGTIVEPPFREILPTLYLGARVYIGPGCCVLAVGEVHIGDDTVLGRAVHLYAADHPRIAKERYPAREGEPPKWRDIMLGGATNRIGKRCYIGDGAAILPWVTIGDGAMVAPGAVVTKDVAPGAVVEGNPAKVVGKKERE